MQTKLVCGGKNVIESFSHDPCLGGRAVFSGGFVKSSFDGLCRNRAGRGGALSENFLTCLHVQGCGLSVMTGIEHRHSFVNGLLDDVIRVACDFFGFGDQNRIDDMDDSV